MSHVRSLNLTALSIYSIHLSLVPTYRQVRVQLTFFALVYAFQTRYLFVREPDFYLALSVPHRLLITRWRKRCSLVPIKQSKVEFFKITLFYFLVGFLLDASLNLQHSKMMTHESSSDIDVFLKTPNSLQKKSEQYTRTILNYTRSGQDKALTAAQNDL